MQGGRGGGNPFFNFGDPFAGLGGFGGFGGQRSLMSSFFGGRDPFDDPFFRRPFGGMFEPGLFGPSGSPFHDMHASGLLEHNVPQPTNSRGPIIEELNSDDEKDEEEGSKKHDNPKKHRRSSKEPYVEHPDDEVEERKRKQVQYTNNLNRMTNTRSQPQNHSFSFQSSSVTYGGANGAYYTSSRTRRSGSDGLTIEESKEADIAARKATHRVSRGIHDKGHSVTRKLNSDGRVDTMQTLHNLDEDELPTFEETWKGNAKKHLPGWSEGFNGQHSMGMQGHGSNAQIGEASRGGRALPSTELPLHPGMKMNPDFKNGSSSSDSQQHMGRARSDIGTRTGSSRGRSRATADRHR